MNKQQKTDFIRGKCVEANPEIMELKFGCEVKWKKYGTTHTIYYGKDSDGKFKFTECGIGYYTEKDVEIVGRPIYLDDLKSVLSYPAFLDICYEWKVGDLEDQDEKVIDSISLRML